MTFYCLELLLANSIIMLFQIFITLALGYIVIFVDAFLYNSMLAELARLLF